jgi:MipA family protein
MMGRGEWRATLLAAQRGLVVRALKGLQRAVPVFYADPYIVLRAALALLLACAAGAAHGTSHPLEHSVSVPGGAGMGFATRVERSPYRGGGTRYDLVPLFLYEGRHLYLHGYRAGIKLDDAARGLRIDAFLMHRFEGHPDDDVPPALAGMERRQPGVDAGIGVRWAGTWGALHGEVMRDVGANSGGTEARLGYQYEWASGRLRLRPHVALAFRDARLNDYYYGVLDEEARPGRGAYAPGRGVNLVLGAFASYGLTERWRLLAGVTATRWPRAVAVSPVVDGRTHTAAIMGLTYDFSPERDAWPESRPLIARVLYGASSGCDVLKIMRLVCTHTHNEDDTSIAGFELGRPFIERVNGWPLDLAGFVGLIRHKERGFQPDFWQVQAYMKAYYYGFPWDARLRTRVAFGAGLAYARRVPLMEVRDQALRGRGTSRLLTYLAPSVDVSVGDLLGVRRLRETYAGVGVSHRSGIFGTSQLLGNVDGGSNYIYGYIEASF